MPKNLYAIFITVLRRINVPKIFTNRIALKAIRTRGYRTGLVEIFIARENNGVLFQRPWK